MSRLKKIIFTTLALAVLISGAARADSLLPSTTAQNPLLLTDPELAGGVAPVPKLVLEPPASVTLPEVVSERDQWRGSQCGVREPRIAAFRHADKWQAFWNQGIAPYSRKFAKVPEIDFTKEMVVGVFMGEKSIPNYQVKILSVRTENRPGGTVLVVRYREIERMIGVFTPPFPIEPFHLKRVPRFDGPIVFKRKP